MYNNVQLFTILYRLYGTIAKDIVVDITGWKSVDRLTAFLLADILYSQPISQ